MPITVVVDVIENQPGSTWGKTLGNLSVWNFLDDSGAPRTSGPFRWYIQEISMSKEYMWGLPRSGTWHRDSKGTLNLYLSGIFMSSQWSSGMELTQFDFSKIDLNNLSDRSYEIRTKRCPGSGSIFSSPVSLLTHLGYFTTGEYLNGDWQPVKWQLVRFST